MLDFNIFFIFIVLLSLISIKRVLFQYPATALHFDIIYRQVMAIDIPILRQHGLLSIGRRKTNDHTGDQIDPLVVIPTGIPQDIKPAFSFVRSEEHTSELQSRE